jgi:hypothetical protein
MSNKTLMPLFVVSFKFLNPNTLGFIEPTLVANDDDTIFRAIISNKTTL